MNAKVGTLLLSGALLPGIGSASTLYVDLNSTNPVAPYSSWDTASTNIQLALDAASVGDLVLVTNGTYSVGSRVPLTGIAVRVAVQKPLTLASVNGSSTTFIVGAGRSGGFLRGVYLTNGAVLAGFTITNGATSEQGQGSGGTGSGAGVYCQSTNCQVTNCVIIGNSAGSGAGVYQGTLLSCILFSNTASGLGGGAYQSVLESCAVAGNSSGQGGGVANSLLSNCTLTGNTAATSGGGAYQSTLNNCIAYYNTAPTDPNATAATLNYCCTTPLPASGSGNIDSEPQLASISHLAPISPCRGAGSAAYAVGLDIDGEPWADPPSIGCDEYSPGLVTGPISVSIVASYTNVAAGFAVGFTGWVWGKVTSSSWDFGDGTGVGYRPFTSHVWTNGGDFPVVLTAYNQDNPGGVSATALVHVVGQPIHYVALASTNPVPPYTSWDTAATNIQDAVSAATAPGESVVVSDGLYNVGGTSAGTTTTNRVAVQQKIHLSSLNGPLVTLIQGQRASGGVLGSDAVRCVYLASGAILDGFTLTNGSTTAYDDGGGVYCQSAATVTNCILSANYAYLGAGSYSGHLINCTFQFNSALDSGGACYLSTLTNCILYNNGANNTAGGAINATLYNCTLSHNSAGNYGAGMASSTLYNCILDYNTAEYGRASYYGTLNNCIVTNNYGYTDGGGMYYGTANNCLFLGNGAGQSVDTGTGGGAAYYGTLNACLVQNNSGNWNGGGTFNSTLNNCVLSGNSTLYGGGAYGGTLRNCTVVGNSGFFSGGGVDQCTCYNCIICYNTQGGGTNNYTGANTFNYCCISPDPGAGSGNITNDPGFVNYATGDLHLQSNSPCINSGNNSLIPGNTDLDGNPRIAGGTVDIGAYEFPNPASLISYAWLQQYGLPTDGSADSLDTDGDGMSNWQEWRAGTVPTDASSVLRLQAPARTPSGPTITWQSVSGITYYLQRAVPALPLTFSTIHSNILGAAGSTSFTDTNAAGLGQALYRVGVQ